MITRAELGGDQVEIRVEAAVCAGPEIAALTAPTGVAPGGAAVGRVTATGDGATHMAGRRVLVGPIDGCGECESCRRGQPFACPGVRVLGRMTAGALSGSVVVRARWLTELAGGLALDGPLAALVAREAADAYALYARAGLAAGEPVAVLGSGPVARLLVQIAAAFGARAVAAGAAGGPGAIERVRAHAAEQPGRPLKIFAVPESADGPDELGLALALVQPGGLVAALSRLPLVPARSADIAGLLAGGGALVGVPAAHPDLIPEVAALAIKGELDLAAVGEVYRAEPGRSPLDDPAGLAARARAAQDAGRALVVAFPA